MPLGEFFKAFLGCYSYGKQIPDQLMHLPVELTLELLRGLFSADGYVSDNKLGIALSNRTLDYPDPPASTAIGIRILNS